MNKCKLLLTKQRVAMASKAKYPEIFCYCLHSTWIWLCGQGVHSGEKEICIWLLEILFLWFFSSFNLLSIINKVLESQRETAGKHQTLFPGLAARCILLSKKWREPILSGSTANIQEGAWAKNSKLLVSNVTQTLADGEWRNTFCWELLIVLPLSSLGSSFSTSNFTKKK